MTDYWAYGYSARLLTEEYGSRSWAHAAIEGDTAMTGNCAPTARRSALLDGSRVFAYLA